MCLAAYVSSNRNILSDILINTQCNSEAQAIFPGQLTGELGIVLVIANKPCACHIITPPPPKQFYWGIEILENNKKYFSPQKVL